MNYYGGDLYPSRGGGGGGSMKAVFLGVVGLAVYGARWWFYSWIAEARRSKQRMQPLWLADKELRCPDIQEESEAKTRSKLFESIDYTLLIHLVGTSTYIPPSLSSSTSDVPAMSGMTSGRSVYSGEMLIEFTLKKENASIALEKGISLNFSGGVIQGLWVNGKHIAADGLALQSPGLFSSLFHHHEPIQWRRHRLYIPGEWLTHTQRNRVFVSFVNGFDHAAYFSLEVSLSPSYSSSALSSISLVPCIDCMSMTMMMWVMLTSMLLAVGMQRTTDARDNEEYLFADGRLYEAHRIFPCFDQPDLQGTFTLTVAAPPNAYVVTNTQVKTVYRDTVEYTLKTRQEETPNVDESLPPSFIDDVPR
ncbi:membrane alanyl aminopeptidase [Cystoisospora suis]|uniref:Membrane alanyl aminopeptidase n=1 Tax=Cystoisospora suis TaxID=483139 RepID=A0A2C6KZZ9_9APIC|nr:membrane alanyl aminopeptidase [Cystoisospora suis]